MIRRLLNISVLWLLLLLLGAAVKTEPPQLSIQDVSVKIREILEAHATHRKLTPKLMGHAVSNYLDQLDPLRTYLTKQDIEEWLDVDAAQQKSLLSAFQNDNVTSFDTLYARMEMAIERRRRIEERIARSELPEEVQPKEFKDPEWADNEEMLYDRLLRLRSLQKSLASAADAENVDKAMERIDRRRERREERYFRFSNEESRQYQVRVFVLKALASALDAQTAYFTPREAEEFLIQLQQRLFGIGVQLREGLDGFSIIQVIENGPAALQGGLRKGDRIVAVDGETVIGMDINDFVRMVRGEAGSSVHLTVLREVGKGEEKHDERVEVDIVRGEVVFKETRIESETLPYGDGVIAHITLHSFYQDERFSSAGDLEEELHKLAKEHNLKGIILDLRTNSGGLLPQAIEVAGLFITKGVIASIKTSGGEIHYLRDLDEQVNWDGPLLVLTSRLSASAAEIVAQSLQDYGRAIVVGDERTFGKGTYQTSTIDFIGSGDPDPLGEYKVTRGTYYTVSGKSPQLTGVQADIVLPSPFSEMDIGEQYSKFPLENDHIPANFHDDLSDIPFFHRARVRKSYHFDLQPRLQRYTRLLPQLQKNAQQRLEINKNYQSFLEQIRDEDWTDDDSPNYGQNDLQLDEAYQIMKDLLYLELVQNGNPAKGGAES